MRRKYAKPPLVEAVCELHFDPSSPFDLAVPGLVYERVKNTFKERQQATHLNINATIGSTNNESVVKLPIDGKANFYRLYRP